MITHGLARRVTLVDCDLDYNKVSAFKLSYLTVGDQNVSRLNPYQLCVVLPLLRLLLLLLSVTNVGRAQEVDFARDIRPLLSENCFFCHGPDEEQRAADLRLDTEDGLSTVITPGDSQASELLRRLLSSDPDEAMPPTESNRHVTPTQVALIARWIDQGAQWQTHWAFANLVSPPIPSSAALDSTAPARPPVRNAIDAFVQSNLSERGQSASPEADRRTLIRRVSLDLTGLPPTPEQVAQFVADPDENAYERLVDRLLDSPAYGQRMAWDWLDAARYADTNGYQGDAERTMWPWRDWVVSAFNTNMPFDQFTIWQLAGDLLPGATAEQKLATGFLRNHMINGEGGRIAEENRIEYQFDMAETTGTVWLGLTMNCCRCHDHKYDPLTNRDYYSLLAYFNQTPVTGGGGHPQTPPLIQWPSQAQQAQIAQAQRELEQQRETLARIDAATTQRPPRPQAQLTETTPPLCVTWQPAYQQAQQRIVAWQAELDSVHAQTPKVMVMADMPQPRKSFMYDRGLYSQPAQEVTAAPPAFLLRRGSSTSERDPQAGTSAMEAAQDRLTLARWIVDEANPLTPRVTVNRVWQQFFGVGLVKTVEDFGVQGELPPQLDLLNWLAADFRDGGWDVKRLVRLIVTSHTYRQSSRQTGAASEDDPENRWLARGSRFRWPSWMLRDQALAASQLLSPITAGAGVNTYQPSGVWEEATFGLKTYKQGHGEELYRRSLYVFWRRIIAPTFFFDTASRQTCTVNSVRTNTPLQSLLMLNDVTYVEAARALAQAALQADLSSDAQRLNSIMQRVLARDATAAEQAILLGGLQRNLQMFDQCAASDEPLGHVTGAVEASEPSSGAVSSPAADAAERAVVAKGADVAEGADVADGAGGEVVAAHHLLSIGQSPRDSRIEAELHASWTVVCLTVLNLDETLNHE